MAAAERKLESFGVSPGEDTRMYMNLIDKLHLGEPLDGDDFILIIDALRDEKQGSRYELEPE